MTDSDLIEQIRRLIAIQKTHHPRTSAWQTASDLLQPLFAEAARRNLQEAP